MAEDMSTKELALELRRAGRALRRAADVVDGWELEPGPPDPPPVPPQPSPSRMILGAEAHRDGLNDLDMFRKFQQTAQGWLEMRVTYTTPRWWPGTYKEHPASMDGQVGAAWSSLSLKPAWNGLDNQRAQLRDFFESITPAKRPYTIVTTWHEPEDNIDAGEFSIQEWTGLQAVTAELGEEFGVLTAACLMAWTWDPRSHRNPQAYRDGASFHPMVAFDGYDDRRSGNEYTGGTPAAQIFGPPVSDSADWGIGAWMIRETGTALSGSQSLEWWSTFWDWAEAGGATALCPWDSDGRADWPWCALTDNERAHLGFLAAGG